MFKFTLKGGETIVGTPNYVTAGTVELRVPACAIGWRKLRRDQIVKRERIAR